MNRSMYNPDQYNIGDPLPFRNEHDYSLKSYVNNFKLNDNYLNPEWL